MKENGIGTSLELGTPVEMWNFEKLPWCFFMVVKGHISSQDEGGQESGPNNG